MKKLFGFSVLIILAAILITVLSMNSIIQRGIEKAGSLILDTHVTLKSANVSVFSGEGTIEQLSIANPDGYSTDKAITVESITIKMTPASVLEDTVVIDSITVNSPSILYELSSQGTNINVLKRRAENFKADTTTPNEDAPADAPEVNGKTSQKNVVIKDLWIKNVQVSFLVPGVAKDKAKTGIIPEIHISNIGQSGSGANAQEVVTKILTELNKELLKINPSSLNGKLDAVTKGVRGKIGDLIP